MNDENLKPFPKGKSGNPKGRPKGSLGMTSQLKKILKKKIKNYDPITDEEVTQSIRNHIINVFVSKAINGEDKAILEIFDRVDGKVPIEGIIDLTKIDVSLTEEEQEEYKDRIKGFYGSSILDNDSER